MGLVKSAIERKLSAALGARVSIGKLNFSLLGKSIEATDVRIEAGGGDSSPLLTVHRVKAEISIAAALKKEIVITSLSIERPVVTVTRSADGTLNLPARRGANKDLAPTTASDTPENGQTDDNAWKFAARKILLVDGELHFRDATGYHVSIEKLLAELKTTDPGPMELTVLSDSVGRRDDAVDLGQLRVNGRVTGVSDMSDFSAASIQGSLHLGELIRAQFDVPKLQPPDVKTQFAATLADVNLLATLLPPNAALPPALRPPALSGKVELAGVATFDGKALRLPEFSVVARDVRVHLAATTTSAPAANVPRDPPA